jgi:electron transport complex protein RnfB
MRQKRKLSKKDYEIEEEKKTMAGSEIDEVYKQIAKKIQGVEFSTVIPKILQKILTVEQAKLALEFPGLPEDLAAKVGRDLNSVKKDLQYMYEIGIGTPAARSGRWNLPRNHVLLLDKVGSHHAKFLPFLGPDYLDLWDEFWEEHIPMRTKDGKFQPPETWRIIPAYKAVRNIPDVQPWENMRSILNMADKIALTNCACAMRTRKKSFPMHSTEVCFMLSKDADYTVNSGAGRYINIDEAVKVIENCEDAGVVHIVYNARAVVSLLCNCRPDVCVSFKLLRRFGNKDPQFIYPSRYRSLIDEKLCDGCGTCVDWCLFGAISMVDNGKGEMKAGVDAEKCMGAGNCAIKCPRKAIDLKCVRPEDYVPKRMGLREGETRDESRYAAYKNL